MHLQPLYAHCDRFGGEVAEGLYERGLCLPSSSSLTAEAQDMVVQAVRAVARWHRAALPGGGNLAAH
jgi:pyridoxal phosphate-dependent aminotransferase EpsN